MKRVILIMMTFFAVINMNAQDSPEQVKKWKVMPKTFFPNSPQNRIKEMTIELSLLPSEQRNVEYILSEQKKMRSDFNQEYPNDPSTYEGDEDYLKAKKEVSDYYKIEMINTIGKLRWKRWQTYRRECNEGVKPRHIEMDIENARINGTLSATYKGRF